jgi:molecular chaperone GrpE
MMSRQAGDDQAGEAGSSKEGIEANGASEDVELDRSVNGTGAGNGEAASEKPDLEAKLSESKDKYLRLLADFENFKRRALKEQSELLKYQGEKIVVDMLEVLDNLELALGHTSAGEESLRTGLEMVHKLFVEKLGRWEIRGESGIGSQFDPQRHSAISRVPGAEAGVIVGELKKSYFYKDKLIRCGEVVVAIGAEDAKN